jgi:hypothetical protein|tara:strand:- start:25119 stop:25889 length:771 start_codon:yes stop_codon:yes gene_type:complete
MLGLGGVLSPTTESGVFSSTLALELNGADSGVVLPDEFIEQVNPNSGTVSVWINMRENNASANQNIFRFVDDDTNNGITLQYHKGHTQFRAVYRLGNVYKEATYEANITHAQYMALGWNHFAVTWESDGAGTGEVKIYYNSVLQETVSQPNNWGSDTMDRCVIGTNEDVSSAFYDGYIDQFAVYNQVKVSSEIQAMYNDGVLADLSTNYFSSPTRTDYKTNGLIAYYQFENNLLDSSGNNFTGTTEGTVTYNTSQP